MHGPEIPAVLARVIQRHHGRPVHAADRHDDDVLGGRRGPLIHVQRQLPLGQTIVPANFPEHGNEHRDQKHHDPRAVRELRDRQHDGGGTGRNGACEVDRQRLSPAAPFPIQPMMDHAGLRQCEGKKDPDGVQRDQGMGVALKDHEEQRGKRSQDDNTVGECEPVALGAHLAGKEAVLRQQRRQPRKPVVARVRGQD